MTAPQPSGWLTNNLLTTFEPIKPPTAVAAPALIAGVTFVAEARALEQAAARLTWILSRLPWLAKAPEEKQERERERSQARNAHDFAIDFVLFLDVRCSMAGWRRRARSGRFAPAAIDHTPGARVACLNSAGAARASPLSLRPLRAPPASGPRTRH